MEPGVRAVGGNQRLATILTGCKVAQALVPHEGLHQNIAQSSNVCRPFHELSTPLWPHCCDAVQ